MCAPSASQEPSTTGVEEAVTVQMMSAPSMAARASALASTVTPASDASATKASRRSRCGLQARTRPMDRTARMASRWDRAWVPEPMMARSVASGRASRRVASPLTAAVRMAVMAMASISATGLPCSGFEQEHEALVRLVAGAVVAREDRDDLDPERRRIAEGGRHAGQDGGYRRLERHQHHRAQRVGGVAARKAGERLIHEVDASVHGQQLAGRGAVDGEHAARLRTCSHDAPSVQQTIPTAEEE